MPSKTLPNLALITPYPSLGTIVTEQCVGLFNCHVYHGSLGKASNIAKNLDPEFYDVIMSRGGTADYIEKSTTIPVVRIVISAADLLKSLIPLKNNREKIAFFNYENYLPEVDLVAQALNVVIDEFTFSTEQDINENLKRCHEENYQTIIGGSPAAKIAQQYNMECILIENGVESVNSSLREALAIVETTKRKHMHMARLEMILSSITEGIIVTNENNAVQYFNKAAQKIFGIEESQIIGKQVDTVIQNTRINQVLLSKSPEIRELQEIGNTSIITSRVPILMGNKCIGVVCSFTDTPQIQRVERKIRGKIIKKGFTAKYKFADIITNSDNMRDVIKLAEIYSKTHSPVMIHGESGTGKELFAQSIHNHSLRKNDPFVAINCAAIPENLLESELFGYEGGSFTGAKREGKEGLIELAHEGTLFLDEIGELPLSIQSRLLRVLQEYEIMRIGGKDLIPVNVRIIGATNRSLDDMASAGTFRSDLYYRLNVLPLTVPPLRERDGDVEYLVKKFLKEPDSEQQVQNFLEVFSSYPWPGNVRELRFILERLSLLSKGFPGASWFEILELTGFKIKDLNNAPEASRTITVDLKIKHLKGIVRDVERQIISFYLKLYNNDQEKVATKLGISKMSMWRKLREKEG
ncbi:PAS domain S-box-containing protein [Gibbsiella quercinecans]|uniref:RNA polymerase subunit sigma-54 n=2 Tax=Enterobacterales TaxID=91347 RepID=A0A250AW46_9GAMM|nr:MULTISPECIES: sigma-54-dependent Fis family transcriptional regulator [Enterobacterales]ATA18139.1 RNA polymerase subunit sigma-54 [Gibbsiella quercinecans]MCT4702130.1 sigma 54-interacting transcriptional regulator [Dryocola boscaweniae]MCT4719426.1 sigma 54-interacting transcriptional regulator [Dryocola boscaweniae]RLM05944.1 RNA polymerase subunit sigma-54 [Gibbsiella quercinecans]TCT92470.1 PAS domain S-box-containing protein [Gibbsiella quercinecans]